MSASRPGVNGKYFRIQPKIPLVLPNILIAGYRMTLLGTAKYDFFPNDCSDLTWSFSFDRHVP